VLIYSVALSIGLLLAGILAWRLSLRETARTEAKPVWRDQSLDEWRRERELEAEREREARREQAEGELTAGSTRDESETKKQQRIGG
jgi:hypothetical protein